MDVSASHLNTSSTHRHHCTNCQRKN